MTIRPVNAVRLEKLSILFIHMTRKKYFPVMPQVTVLTGVAIPQKETGFLQDYILSRFL